MGAAVMALSILLLLALGAAVIGWVLRPRAERRGVMLQAIGDAPRPARHARHMRTVEEEARP